MSAGALQLELFRRAESDADLDSEDYRVRISRRARRLQLKVTPAGQVEVVVPHGLHPRHITPFVERHRQWIEQALAELAERRRQYPHLHVRCPDIIQLPALQRHWQVAYEQRGRNHVHGEGDGSLSRLRVQYRHPGEIPRLLRNWVMNTARRELLPWLASLSEETGLLYSHAGIRRQKTLWGSCTRDGRISLNCNLLFLAPEQARYICIHELCHTRHCNHSARFWTLVGRHEPDYRRLDQSLSAAARTIPVWACQA